MRDNRETCFVIMPIGKTSGKHSEEYWHEHYYTFLKPLIEENANLKAERSEALRGDILREIITNLVVARVVVADLTDNNCNVYWELGGRQSFKHCTVTIAETQSKIPFDIFAKGTLRYYPNDYIRNTKFREKFKKALEDCLTNPNKPDSHVLETLSGRGTLFEIFRKDEAMRRLDAVISECNINLWVLETTTELAEKNKEDAENRKFASNRLRQSALELLVTNRYVEEEATFYEIAEHCLQDALVVNSMLNLWTSEPKRVEAWLSEHIKPDRIARNRQFLDKVTAAREKLSKTH
jgi:hypothetical protein